MANPLNIGTALAVRAGMIAGGIGALGAVLGPILGAVTGGDAGKAKARAVFAANAGQRQAMRVLRAFWPTLSLRAKLINCYDNTGTVLVTRHADVIEVLTRQDDFAVVYEPRMRRITAGENFFLGMQDGPAYSRDADNMRVVVRRGDVAGMVVPVAAATAEAAVAAAPGRLDVVAPLMQAVPLAILDRYFGTPGPSPAEMADWATTLFWWLFADLENDPAVTQRAEAAAAACRAWLDGAIAARKAAAAQGDDVLGRCLAQQAAGVPGFDDLAIRNNLIGLLIGLVPTLAKQASFGLSALLDRPHALRQAQRAAQTGDDATLAAVLFEAMRFEPMGPLIYRRALRDSVIARGTLRQTTIKKDRMVVVSTLSAMFDPLRWPAPEEFRPGRAWETYMLWGHGMHTCFGQHINRAVLPEMVKPLLKRTGLRRAAGPAGQIDPAGTPFPVHFTVEWDESAMR